MKKSMNGAWVIVVQPTYEFDCKKWNVIEIFRIECEFGWKLKLTFWIVYCQWWFCCIEHLNIICCLHATNVQPQLDLSLEMACVVCLLGDFQPNKFKAIFNGTMLIMPISLCILPCPNRFANCLDRKIFSKQTKLTKTTAEEGEKKIETESQFSSNNERMKKKKTMKNIVHIQRYGQI